jgi:hypothetical protein
VNATLAEGTTTMHHILAVFEGSSAIKLYIDNTFVGQTAYVKCQTASNQYLYIGYTQTGGWGRFCGRIDQVILGDIIPTVSNRRQLIVNPLQSSGFEIARMDRVALVNHTHANEYLPSCSVHFADDARHAENADSAAYAYQAEIANSLSDQRMKANITAIQNPIFKLNKIRAVEFDWNVQDERLSGIYSGHDIGFIAQELEDILPESIYKRSDGYLGVKDRPILALLLEVVKSQQNEINQLKTLIN